MKANIHIEQLRAEKAKIEVDLKQLQHQQQRLENRVKYYEKRDRAKRTHRLCVLGGTVESLAPEIRTLTRTETTDLLERIFSLPEVQTVVRISADQHKEKLNDGAVSSEC